MNDISFYVTDRHYVKCEDYWESDISDAKFATDEEIKTLEKDNKDDSLESNNFKKR